MESFESGKNVKCRLSDAKSFARIKEE